MSEAEKETEKKRKAEEITPAEEEGDLTAAALTKEASGDADATKVDQESSAETKKDGHPEIPATPSHQEQSDASNENTLEKHTSDEATETEESTKQESQELQKVALNADTTEETDQGATESDPDVEMKPVEENIEEPASDPQRKKDEGPTEVNGAGDDSATAESSQEAKTTPSEVPQEQDAPMLPPNNPKSDGLVNEYSDPSYSNIRYSIIENDGSPAALIKLVGLKSLFAKQLPKMPRAYIARLVFDKRHVSLAILSPDPSVCDTDEEIIGAICYRPFHEQRFAEIAFFKGYGTKLMILLKQHAARDGIEYFITYADNFAIGYFKKQGFTKSITMPKGRYHGLIKDYDGGTPMECYIHPSIDFTRIDQMVEAQRKFILDRIALTAKSATAVYQPVRKVQVEESPLARSNPSVAKAMSIPGVAEAGWTVADLMPDTANSRDGGTSSATLKTELLEAIRKISEQQYAWPFREPVNTEEVPDYLEIIKHPIDLKTMERKAKQDTYKSKQMLFNDVMLMCDNCRVFNEDGSQYTQCANKVERYTRNILPDCTRQTPKK